MVNYGNCLKDPYFLSIFFCVNKGPWEYEHLSYHKFHPFPLREAIQLMLLSSDTNSLLHQPSAQIAIKGHRKLYNPPAYLMVVIQMVAVFQMENYTKLPLQDQSDIHTQSRIQIQPAPPDRKFANIQNFAQSSHGRE